MLEQQLQLFPRCDANEAPVGYYAVLKKNNGYNICRDCDWRKTCNDPTTDFLAYGHRCMDYPIIASRDGRIYQRNDRSSVIFKKLPTPIVPASEPEGENHD